MTRRWSQLPGWRRGLMALNALVILEIAAWFVFDFSFLLTIVPAIVVVVFTFVLLALDKRRQRRDGSYWGPRNERTD